MNVIDNRTEYDPVETTETERGGVIWISGYSAAGKTTVGRKVLQRLRAAGSPAIFLDGDDLRSIFANRWGYSREERIELALVYFRLSSTLAAQGNTVIISAVAMYDEVRAWVRDNIDRAVEIYLSVPREELIARDAGTKRVYSAIGDVDSLYDPARDPHLAIENFGANTPDTVADRIVAFYKGFSAHPSDRGRTRHWAEFYRTAKGVFDPSPFALHVAGQLQRRADIIELGCGNGRDAAYFAHLGHAVTAVDMSEAAIALCKDKHAGLPVRFLAGSLDALSAGWDRGFDLLYTRFVLHAMPVQEEILALNAAARILRPGGRIAIECRSINDPLARLGEVLSPTERIHGHYRRFIVLDELVARLADAGFRVVDAVESNGLARYGDEDPVVLRVTGERNG
jgi:adenylylsulfate kinase-like enzyme/2-polyprenyl-3-methyl-5-hydroxy-6-metoxy-1,4-benzoquinol methylase